MTKVDIISGFLGAGKTTLIRKILESALKGEKIVLIENEFGEIGIDGGFLKDSGVEVTEMNSGCICCTLVGDFGKALEEVIETYQPERIIIEPSGVGKLSDVIRAVKGVAEKTPLALNSYTAVADAVKYKMYQKNFGEFFSNQIENARTIVLSRTQNLSPAQLEALLEQVKAENPEASVITTPWDELSGQTILSAMEHSRPLERELLEKEEICPSCGHHHQEGGSCHGEHDHHGHEHEHEHEHGHGHEHEHGHDHCCHDHEHGHHHHHADEVFASWGKETAKRFTEDGLLELLGKLDDEKKYGAVLRAKGIVMAQDGGWLHFDHVPGEADVRKGSADYTGRLCVIGAQLQTDALSALFGV